MNLPDMIGTPIERNINGTIYTFPRLSIRELGEVVDKWTKEETDKEAKPGTPGWIFGKLTNLKTGPDVVEKSLRAIQPPTTIHAHDLRLDPVDFAELAVQLWSREFLRIFRDSQKAMEQPQAPKAETARPPGSTG